MVSGQLLGDCQGSNLEIICIKTSKYINKFLLIHLLSCCITMSQFIQFSWHILKQFKLLSVDNSIVPLCYFYSHLQWKMYVCYCPHVTLSSFRYVFRVYQTCIFDFTWTLQSDARLIQSHLMKYTLALTLILPLSLSLFLFPSCLHVQSITF